VATSKHDYYTGSGEAAGVWTGSGRSDLGLDGEVDADDMAALYGRFVDPRTRGDLRSDRGRIEPEVILGQRVSIKERGDGTVAEPVAAFDVTFSPAKSVSVLWGTASDVAVRTTIVEVHDAAVAEALAYLETHASHTRAGRNGVRQVETSGFVIAQFRHRTARSVDPSVRIGDPQLHSHCAILNRVRAVEDGKWRTLDGAAIYRHAHAAGALYGAVMERELTRRLGVGWDTPAERVPMREITGISDRVRGVFSARRAQVLVTYEAMLAAWTAAHDGRSPTTRERLALMGDATLKSRHAKRQGPDVDLHDQWRQRLGPVDVAAVDAVVDAVTDPGVVRMRVGDGGRLAAGSDELAAAVVEVLQRQRAWWQRAHVYAEVARLTDTITDVAISRDVEMIVARHFNLTVDDDTRYAQPDVTKFTSTAIHDAEARVLAATSEASTWTIPTRVAAELGDDQQAAVDALATAPGRVVTVIGPAGSGKTTMIRAVNAVYEHADRPIQVLTLSAAAARVVTDETGIDASTIASWEVGAVDLPRRGLVIIDEASMVPTLTLDHIVAVAARYDTRVALIGDPAQMGAPEAGGLLADLAEQPSAVHMTTIRRFTEPWEADATTELRARDPDVTHTYFAHGRLHPVQTATAIEGAVAAWLTDTLAGIDSLICVDTATQAATVAAVCQRHLAAHQHIGERVGLGRDANAICVGDRIQTRHNTAALTTSTGERVLNRDVWTVTGRSDDGTINATHLARGHRVEIPASYAAEHVTLAYAVTIAGGQGRTVDTGHTIVTPRTNSLALYVAMTRGRTANHAWVITDNHDHDEFELGTRTVTTAFANAVERVPTASQSAHTTARRWRDDTEQRDLQRHHDRVRRDATDWWTSHQNTLQPHVRQALTGRHHNHIIGALTGLAPHQWGSAVTAAIAKTRWRDRDAGIAFVTHLATPPDPFAPIDPTRPAGNARHAPRR
jgi:conjugative relaxase-like TrwC/TraI family protein